MAKKAKTFPKVLRVYILICLIITLAFYTVVLNIYMLSGTWLAASFEMEIFGRQYERELRLNPNAPLPPSFNITAYEKFEDVPELIRAYLGDEELVPGQLYDVDHDDLDDDEIADQKLYYFVFPYELKNSKILYLVQGFHEDDDDSEFFNNMDQLAFTTLPMAGVFFVIFLILLWFVGRKLSKPSQKLAQWTQNLSTETLKEPVPDFGFQELNDVAREFHQSLVRIDGFVERERDFVRQASHELRTPVTVLSGNVELLQKHELSGAQTRVVKRIDRAAQNMKQLIETLLWLGREMEKGQEVEHIDLVALTNEAVEELQYLFETVGIDYEQRQEQESLYVNVPKAALYIVISNLLRNAFQHTPQGKVSVHLSSQAICVENYIQSSTAHSEKPQGHGIGLKLVEKVCDKCRWALSLEEINGGGLRAQIIFENRK